MRNVLILGGTTEARVLAAQLAQRLDLAVTLSLAGRTSAPRPQEVTTRQGGFGGVEGLSEYLRVARIDLLIDATHPYAAKISGNAKRAALSTGVPLLAICRPPWDAVPGDRWIEVDDAAEGVEKLGSTPRRVFVALGRRDLQFLVRAPQHCYLIRSVDPVDPRLAVPDARYILARGPFYEEADRELLRSERIDVVIAKNSGGAATYSKIAAARALGIQVVIIRRPAACAGVATVDEAMQWIEHHWGLDRGV